MKTICAVAALALMVAVPAWAQSPVHGTSDASDLSTVLNKANQMNYEEIQDANLARSRAGDNQALMSYADTLRADHKINEDAVAALARQKDVTLHGTKTRQAVTAKLQSLKGGEFNEAFLTNEIASHKKAIDEFKSFQSQAQNDPDLSVYLGQTIPALEAHLKMAENLKNSLGTGPNAENPANNMHMANSHGHNH